MCLAVPGKVIEICSDDPVFPIGKVSFGGIIKEVNLCYVPEVKVGEYVVVHVGFALSILDEEEADKVFEYLRQMSELEETDKDSA